MTFFGGATLRAAIFKLCGADLVLAKPRGAREGCCCSFITNRSPEQAVVSCRSSVRFSDLALVALMLLLLQIERLIVRRVQNVAGLPPRDLPADTGLAILVALVLALVLPLAVLSPDSLSTPSSSAKLEWFRVMFGFDFRLVVNKERTSSTGSTRTDNNEMMTHGGTKT